MTALVDQMGDRVMPYLKLDATWKTRVTTALKRQAPQTRDQSQQKRLIGALENLRKQHLWGVLSDDDPGYHSPKFQVRIIMASHINQEDAWL